VNDMVVGASADEAAAALTAALAAQADAVRAAGQAAYLKSSLQFLGVKVPAVRRTVRSWLKAARPDHAHLIAVADALWAGEGADGRAVFECRLAAVEVLHGAPALLGAADLARIEALLRECGTWALVDPLAGWVVGEIARRDPEATLPVLDRWVSDRDFWVRRSAVLALGRLLAAGQEQDRFFAYATRLLPEKEFFIRKVIGWVMRDEAGRQPAAVEAWLRANMAQMNLVTLREPLRRFPPNLAAELRACYDTRR